ncbi:MAG TPA: hypothetical protein QGF35_08205 [Dehalococcoidia bacterium]|jgi:hypothetical protein|nr:hypothetical protein [Dehalococcoidia bacterium]
MTKITDQRYISSAMSLQTVAGFLLTIVSIRLLRVVEDGGGGASYSPCSLLVRRWASSHGDVVAQTVI